MTPEVQSILERACNDCLSHRTRWPWYSDFAPVSWQIADDVKFGRGNLNFSEWSQYDAEVADRLLGRVCREVSSGWMPLPAYTRLHPRARLSAGDTKALCEWTYAERQRLASQSKSKLAAKCPEKN